MKIIEFLISVSIILVFCSCSSCSKFNPAQLNDDCIINLQHNRMILLSNDTNYFIARKLFKGNNCPEIIYNKRYFNSNPFFVKRTIPLNLDSNIVFIDYYGKGIDSLNYEELEILFYLSGKQTVKLNKVFILDECYAIGNEVTTKIIKRKELARIAKEWNLSLTE